MGPVPGTETDSDLLAGFWEELRCDCRRGLCDLVGVDGSEDIWGEAIFDAAGIVLSFFEWTLRRGDFRGVPGPEDIVGLVGLRYMQPWWSG